MDICTHGHTYTRTYAWTQYIAFFVLHVHTFLVEDGVSPGTGEEVPLRGLSTSFFIILVGTGVTIVYNVK